MLSLTQKIINNNGLLKAIIKNDGDGTGFLKLTASEVTLETLKKRSERMEFLGN